MMVAIRSWVLIRLVSVAVIGGLAVPTTLSAAELDCPAQVEVLTPSDRQEIESLRRQYALATDLIGMGAAAEIKRARAIYQRIFTADADIRAVSKGEIILQGRGPDNWVAHVQQALEPYTGVQHLIGTQLVSAVCAGSSADPAEAVMSSYLQAWHDRAGEHVLVYIGTYHDRVRHVPGVGWKIYDMELEQVSTIVLSH